MFLDPILRLLNALLPSFLLRVIISCFSFSFDHHFDGSVDEWIFLKGPRTDVLATVGTVFLANQRLVDAVGAERVAADGGARVHNQVHADGACYTV